MKSEHQQLVPETAEAAAPVERRDRGSVITITGYAVPMLHFEGYWLKHAGFPIGTWAKVRAGNGRIVIEARGHLSDAGQNEARDEKRRSLRG